jgi:hypothetical protein
MLGCEAPALGAHLEDAERRRVVDEDCRLASSVPIAWDSLPQSRSPRNTPPRRRCASMRASAVSMRREELLLRHLEAEETDRHVRLACPRAGRVQHQASFPHRRSGRDDETSDGGSPDGISSKVV